jgi:hypothetical protein
VTQENAGSHRTKPQSIRGRARRAVVAALIVGTCLTGVSLFLPDLLPIAASCLAVFIARAAYRTSDMPGYQSHFLVTRWTHLIAVGASLLGGIWTGMLYTGVCSMATTLGIVESGSLRCGKHQIATTFWGAIVFLLIFTGIVAFWFWHLVRSHKKD